MGSRIVVPFDNRPSATAKGTGTYTCPAGYYARVTVSVSGYANNTYPIPSGGSPATATSNSFNESFDIWVKAGDTVSATLTNSSGTTAIGATSGGVSGGITTAEILHNSTRIAFFQAEATLSAHNGTGAPVNITRGGGSSFTYYAEEHPEIT